MKSNECTELVEYKDPKQFSVRNFYVYQNALYYEVFTSDVNYSDIYDFKAGKYIDDPLKHDRCQIVKHNLVDNSEEILFDSLTTHLIGGNGGKLYISEKEADDYSLLDKKITEYSLSDSSMRDVFINEGDYYSASVHNGYIIYTEFNEIIVLNISTGDAKTITQNDVDIYTFSFATEEYAVMKKVGIQEIYGLVPFEEFADGDIENIKTIEFENLSLIREGV